MVDPELQPDAGAFNDFTKDLGAYGFPKQEIAVSENEVVRVTTELLRQGAKVNTMQVRDALRGTASPSGEPAEQPSDEAIAALAFYAEPSNWKDRLGSPAWNDKGEKARAALSRSAPPARREGATDRQVVWAEKYLREFITYEPGKHMVPQREKAEAALNVLLGGTDG